jgi:transcriptional antiterminator RfaH
MYWACAQLEANRERLALHCLGLAGYVTWVPRLRVKRVTPTPKVAVSMPALFPNYLFVQIELQWHSARWSPGVIRLVMSGDGPAHVPDAVIAELKGRERNGFVELAKPGLKIGSRVRIISGALSGRLGLYAGMGAHERIEVLLEMLGAQRQVQVSRAAVEPFESA